MSQPVQPLRHLLLPGLLLLNACAPGDAFDTVAFDVSPEARNAPWPSLLPVDQAAALLSEDIRQAAPEDTGPTVTRAARLRRAARALSAPVLTEAERARLTSAAARHAQP